MLIAILFNSDDPRLGGYYGPPIRDLVFGTGVLQSANRHLKIAHGDVLTYSNSKDEAGHRRIAEATYFAGTWSMLRADRLRATYFKETVYAWVIQNATKSLAERLDMALRADEAYLGLLEVDFAIPAHLVLFRNSMPHLCRVQGTHCILSYSMGNEDEKDEYLAEALLKVGFAGVDWEDRGAHGTIFDDFDTPEHFGRLRQVEKVFASVLPDGDDEASELVMMLEDLNPGLFNALGAAVRALAASKTGEDYAHVGISGRRYIEQLADVLFPATDVPYKGRSVTAAKFKNRIWAFIDQSLPATSPTREDDLKALGGEVDRLIDSVNALLHGEPHEDSAIRAFADLAKLTVALLELDPRGVRHPYRAFEKKIVDFFREHLEQIRSEKPKDAPE